MTAVARIALALAVSLAVWPACAVAQSRRRPPPDYVDLNPPDQEEGARILGNLRNIGLAGPYYLEFDLRVLPRRGAETRMSGRWFGTRNVSGPLTRVEVYRPDGTTGVWLVQGGARPAIWSGVAGGEFALLDTSKPGAEAALGGTNISAVDVQTPFMYWQDFTYEGLVRFRGRPTYKYLLYPPDDQAQRLPGIGGVRVFIDTGYEVFSQAQWVGGDGVALKTITFLDFKEIDGRWIVKSFDVRDEATRDKTRLVVRAAALDVGLPGEIFVPVGEIRPAEVQVPAEALHVIP